MTYFTNVTTVAELKAQYKKLILKHHPDVAGGSNEAMKQINAEYETLFKQVENEETKKQYQSVNDGFRETLEKVIHLKEVEIEIIGSWTWVSGNTYAYKDYLKSVNFRYSATKKAWYTYKGIEDNKKHFRGRYNMNQIRNMHGSVRVENEDLKAIG